MFTPEWLSALSSLVLVFATIVYVYFTYKLTKETTKLREIETTPFISIYTRATNPIEMVIENIGKAPAYDIEIDFDDKYLDCFLFDCTKNKHRISYFSPNQQFTILLKQYRELEKTTHKFIPVSVRYQSKDGKVFEDTFNIEWKYLSSSEIEKDGLKEIKRELEKTTKTLEQINKTIKKKQILITYKLKILEFENTGDFVNIIFSNGFIKNVPISQLAKELHIENPDKYMIRNGDLCFCKDEITFLAEEVYALLDKQNKNMETN